jgi:hypothetical protein
MAFLLSATMAGIYAISMMNKPLAVLLARPSESKIVALETSPCRNRDLAGRAG